MSERTKLSIAFGLMGALVTMLLYVAGSFCFLGWGWKC